MCFMLPPPLLHPHTLTCVIGMPVFLPTEAFSSSNLVSGGSFRKYCRQRRKAEEKGGRERRRRKAEEKGRGEKRRRNVEEKGRGERQRRKAEEKGRGERRKRKAEEKGRGERQRKRVEERGIVVEACSLPCTPEAADSH